MDLAHLIRSSPIKDDDGATKAERVKSRAHYRIWIGRTDSGNAIFRNDAADLDVVVARRSRLRVERRARCGNQKINL